MHKQTTEIIPEEDIPKGKDSDYIKLTKEEAKELQYMNRHERRAWAKKRKLEKRRLAKLEKE